MRRLRTILALTLLFSLAACRTDKLDLAYRFSEGTVLKYSMHATAAASWDIGGTGEGSYDVTFEVVEAVQAVEEDGAVVAVSMSPESSSSHGLPAPGPDARSFTLKVGQNGEVREVLEVDGISAQDLNPNDVAFIGTYRPPLPLEPVPLQGSWRSRQEVQVGSVLQELATLGTLTALDRDRNGRTATMVYRGEGPVSWRATLPQGAADLTGTAATSSDAVLDIDGGFLRSAGSTTSGNFDVQVLAQNGGAPLDGTLHLELYLDLRKL
ncbi:MAG: hypothetical protein LC808_12940 [Actinobacteria bacterium]|nr:hypothetical protein [Actinomycetota bacterium]